MGGPQPDSYCTFWPLEVLQDPRRPPLCPWPFSLGRSTGCLCLLPARLCRVTGVNVGLPHGEEVGTGQLQRTPPPFPTRGLSPNGLPQASHLLPL